MAINIYIIDIMGGYHSKPYYMKWFALLGTVLFLGVALAPSINANVNPNQPGKLRTINVYLCKDDKINPYPIQLTPSQDKIIDQLFEDTRYRLERASTEAEHTAILYALIDRLFSLNIFDDSIKKDDLKRLVTLPESNELIHPTGNNMNINCVVIGSTRSSIMFRNPENMNVLPSSMNSGTVSLLDLIILVFALLFNLWEELQALLFNLWFVTNLLFGEVIERIKYIISNLLWSIQFWGERMNPFFYKSAIYFGMYIWDDFGEEGIFYPAKGWIYSRGKNGVQYVEGRLWGTLEERYIDYNPDTWIYKGIQNFTGIYLDGLGFLYGRKMRYIGYASQVGCTTNYP